MSNKIPSIPFSQSHCPACGHSLSGLPPCGPCPQCGTPYNDQVLILFGWPKDRLRGDPTFTVFYIAAMCLSIFLWIDFALALFGDFFLLVIQNWKAAGSFLLVVTADAAGAALLLLLARWLRRRADLAKSTPKLLGPPTLQLRLEPLGYSSRQGFGPPHPLLSWRPDLEIDLTLKGPVAYLRIARLSPVGAVDWSTIVNIAFPATAEHAAALRTHIHTFRANAISHA